MYLKNNKLGFKKSPYFFKYKFLLSHFLLFSFKFTSFNCNCHNTNNFTDKRYICHNASHNHNKFIFFIFRNGWNNFLILVLLILFKNFIAFSPYNFLLYNKQHHDRQTLCTHNLKQSCIYLCLFNCFLNTLAQIQRKLRRRFLFKYWKWATL